MICSTRCPCLGGCCVGLLIQCLRPIHVFRAQPFRLVGVGKNPDQLRMAQQTYLERLSPCNVGWCQDLLQAASLNLSSEAVGLLVERAAIGPVISGCTSASQKGCVGPGDGGFYRFRGFTPDGEAGGNQPNNNQLSGMRSGLNKMLMMPLDDAKYIDSSALCDTDGSSLPSTNAVTTVPSHVGCIPQHHADAC